MPEHRSIQKKIAVNAKNGPRLYKDLLSILESPGRSSELSNRIDSFIEVNNLSESGGSKLKQQALYEGIEKIPLKWPNTKPLMKLFSSAPDKANPLELAQAFYPKSYICYISALFWNDLTKQVPRTFHIAHERATPTTTSSNQFDDLELRDAFIKLPADHRNIATFQGFRYIILARANTSFAGIEPKEVLFLNKTVKILLTNLERTLLDCASVPENAGGISNVIEAFERSANKIDIFKLCAIYKKLKLKYPHWQRVGLILEKIGELKKANEWKQVFGSPKNKFFISKGYKLEWEYDSNWSIFYPKGLFR